MIALMAMSVARLGSDDPMHALLTSKNVSNPSNSAQGRR